MAEEETTEEESAPKEKKSSNLLMIIIIVVLILIIIIGAVVAVLLMSGDDEAVDATSAPQAKEKTVSKQSRRSASSALEDTRTLDQIGTLYPLDTFTVNLKSDSGRRYLKVTMSLELEGEELSMELDAKAPVLRDRIIRILSSKTLEEISSKKGKQKVSEQIMDTLNAMLTDGRIKGIYFTEFVIQ
ncbi:flagellar basal body-associated protein FliL [Sulfurimonas paralvinellae]|uniref:Flagellar protein FliL n=1 Tax=Sulfurimonas paralvinellae TaxID=317658 RepID=A0A7M1B8H4_9BACT|nr:flagellar basal body-associated protein FliL [Sulfurimonas paralvinellae]QOP46020.1 flagellar basal body-associated protein FliL [Sulfurimonas paralvinellae]